MTLTFLVYYPEIKTHHFTTLKSNSLWTGGMFTTLSRIQSKFFLTIVQQSFTMYPQIRLLNTNILVSTLTVGLHGILHENLIWSGNLLNQLTSKLVSLTQNGQDHREKREPLFSAFICKICTQEGTEDSHRHNTH